MAKNVFGHAKFLATTFAQVKRRKTPFLPTFCEKPYYYRSRIVKRNHTLYFSLQSAFFLISNWIWSKKWAKSQKQAIYLRFIVATFKNRFWPSGQNRRSEAYFFCPLFSDFRVFGQKVSLKKQGRSKIFTFCRRRGIAFSAKFLCTLFPIRNKVHVKISRSSTRGRPPDPSIRTPSVRHGSSGSPQHRRRANILRRCIAI